MNAPDQFIAQSATVDEAAVAPLPNSRKIYVEGSRPDIRVPMREIAQADTVTLADGRTFLALDNPEWDQEQPLSGVDFGYMAVKVRGVF